MFITKKKYENALHEAKCEVAAQWERKMGEFEKNVWADHEKYRERDDYNRRFDSLANRILVIEKYLGLVEDKPTCPFEVTPRY